MTAEVIDYRVSRIVVLCKDCGQDVGLYPARHKCGIPSSETPPLPSIPKKYLSAGKTTDNSENSKLWNKFLRATAINNNADYDSDNESEKEEWEGETHISRILREYYENKGVDLPDWLYDLDSTTFVSNIDNNIDRGHQLSKSQTLMNYPPPPNSFNGPTTSTLPKNMDQRRYNDRSINNTLLLGGQPFPNVRSTSDYGNLMSKKSYQQLRTKSGGHISTNPSSRSDQHFIPRDIRRFNYNSNPYENDGHGKQEAPPSGPRGPSRNNRKAGFF